MAKHKSEKSSKRSKSENASQKRTKTSSSKTQKDTKKSESRNSATNPLNTSENLLIAAHFATGPTPPASQLNLRPFVKQGTSSQLTIIGESTVQTYRSIEESQKPALIGIYDPETGRIHFEKATGVTMSHAEVRSQEYMKRFRDLNALIHERKMKSSYEMRVERNLVFGDRRTKNKSKEATFGLRPKKDNNAFVRKAEGISLDQYKYTPYALKSVNVYAETPEEVYKYERLFGAALTIMDAVKSVPRDWDEELELQPWLKKLLDTPGAREKTETLIPYKYLVIFLAAFAVFRRCKAQLNGDNLTFTDENATGDEVQIWSLTGDELLSRFIKMFGGSEDHWSTTVKIDQKKLRLAFVRLMIAALFLTHKLTGQWKIARFEQFCKDSGMPYAEGMMLAQCSGLREDTADLCVYFKAPFHLKYSEQTLAGTPGMGKVGASLNAKDVL